MRLPNGCLDVCLGQYEVDDLVTKVGRDCRRDCGVLTAVEGSRGRGGLGGYARGFNVKQPALLIVVTAYHSLWRCLTVQVASGSSA